MEGTAVGRARCKSAQEQQLRPFIVEWDATDLAQFEAHAANDLVVVKYEGCELEVLQGCVDRGVPGRYGKYAPPQFTSGSLEQIDIENEDELFAELPLGVATFGGRVEQGEKLHLQYFVTGVATATRDGVTPAALSSNPGCEQATHFVWQYQLGAFELSASETSDVAVSAEVKQVGGGSKHKRRAANLKRGGDLASCTTHAQTSCRVPIRLVLRKLEQGASGTDGTPPAAPAATDSEALTPEQQAHQLRNSARDKERNGDGGGCLEDLARADRLDPNGARNPAWLFLRAYCQMRAGQCEAGQKTYREFLVATDRKRELSDERIAKMVESSANSKCPSSTGTTEQRITRAMAALGRAQRSSRPNAEACLAEVKRSEDLLRKKYTTAELRSGPNPYSILHMAAGCLAKAKRCDEARELWYRYYDLNWPDEPRSSIEKAKKSTFSSLPGCQGK
jgi:hypothetical protein